MKVAETGMNNLDEEFWVMQEAGSKYEVKHEPDNAIYVFFFSSRKNT